MLCYEHYPAVDGYGILEDIQYRYVRACYMYMKDYRFYVHEDDAIVRPKKVCERVYCYECDKGEATVCTYKLHIICRCGLEVIIPRRQLIWVRACR